MEILRQHDFTYTPPPDSLLGRRSHAIVPNKNLHYVTNLGWLRGYDAYGNYFDNEMEALNYMLAERCGTHRDPLQRMFLKSLLYRRARSFWIAYVQNATKNKRKFEGNEWVKESLWKIKELCALHESEFKLFLIPTRWPKDVNPIEENLHIFEGLDPIYPSPSLLESADYREDGNLHFNNQGHRKYADFVIGRLPGVVAGRDTFPPG